MHKRLYKGGMYGLYRSMHLACFCCLWMLHNYPVRFLTVEGLTVRERMLLRKDVFVNHSFTYGLTTTHHNTAVY